MMNTEFDAILASCKTNASYYTHICLRTHIKYCLSRDKILPFLQNYIKTIQQLADVETAGPSTSPRWLSLAEKPLSCTPLIVDIDLKKQVVHDDPSLALPFYTKQQVICVVRLVQQAIIKHVDFQPADRNAVLSAFVLERDAYTTTPTADGHVVYKKNGFHLQFPNAFMTNTDAEMVLASIRESLPFSVEEFGESVLDTTLIKAKTPWLMYGSSKSLELPPYVLTFAVDSQGVVHQDPIPLIIGTRLIINDDTDATPTTRNDAQDILPVFFSTVPFGRKVYDLKPTETQRDVKRRRTTTAVESNNNESDWSIAQSLIPLLDPARANPYADWIYVGLIIFNISRGSDEGLRRWKEFSQQTTRINCYSETVCDEKWRGFTKGTLTLATLRFLVKQDDPEGYNSVVSSTQLCLIESPKFKVTHQYIANIIAVSFSTVLKCGHKKKFYTFEKHIWELDENNKGIHDILNGPINEQFEYIKKETQAQYCRLLEDNDDGQAPRKSRAELQALSNLKERVKLYDQAITKIQDENFTSGITSKLSRILLDRNFEDQLNMNPLLIAFQNGIYDMATLEFRDGRPEDKLSRMLPVNYCSELTLESKKVQDMLNFFVTVFPDASLRDYFFLHMSDIFHGGNLRKLIYFWIGEGYNGKSVTSRLFSEMLGEFLVPGGTTIITGRKPDSQNADPQIARLGNGARLLVMDEPNPTETIQLGQIKALTGNDKMFARDLYEAGKSVRVINPMIKTIMIANKLLPINGMDDAMARRIHVIPFESKFVKENVPATFSEQLYTKTFPMIEDLIQTIGQKAEALAWYLLYIYKDRKLFPAKYDHDFIPPKVAAATDAYREQNNVLLQFSNANLIADAESKLDWTEVHLCFTSWMKSMDPNCALNMSVFGKKPEFFIALGQHLKKPIEGKRDKYIKGFRIGFEEDIEEVNI